MEISLNGTMLKQDKENRFSESKFEKSPVRNAGIPLY